MRLNELFRRIVFTLKRRQMDRELVEEMRQHLELKTQKNLAAGMAAEEARYAAQRQLGNLTRMEEESRRTWGFPFLESLLQDIRYSVRGLGKAPGFTLVAMVTLALGIGATTAIFSVINTVLLRPLPYKDSQRIARIQTITPMFPEFQLDESIPDYNDIKAGARSFEALALYEKKAINLTGPGDPEQISTANISSELLPLLGISPALGRGFLADDEQRKSGDVVLLSHGLWRERFASDPNVVGKSVTLEQKPYTVIGVMPAGFEFPNKETAVWTPLILTPENSKPGNWFFSVLAKIRAEQGQKAAQTELDGIAARLGAEYPQTDKGIQFKLIPLQEEVTGEAKSGLMLLLGAVGFLLLIACANVSNLILSRGLERQSEIAMRAALGASRPRILRQLLVESLVLSCLGGAAGMLLAVYGVDAYRALAPANVPRLSELHVEPIAWFALALSSLAGILCGLAPALHTSRADLNMALKDRTAAGGRSRFSLLGALVTLEVALAVVLLDGSALMAQSMVRLLSVDAGFRTDHVLTAALKLPESRYPTAEARHIFVQQLLDKLHANDRLKAVALSDSAALTDNLTMMALDPGALGAGDKSTTLQMRSVAPEFFETLGIGLISGRVFTVTDTKSAPCVAIINESLSRRYFSGQNALGKLLKFGSKADDQCQVIGVVADTRDVHLRAAPRPQVYLPLLRNTPGSLHLFIRTSADPLALANELRKTVWAIDKEQPVSQVQSMTEVIAKSVAEPRFRTWLLGAFATAGLTLTLVGIYGVVSYMAGQRTREIGIRVALGAQRSSVLRLVVGEGIRLAGIGAATGVMGALALTRLAKNQLYDIKPADPMTLAGAAALMILVALAACYVPARRATRVDPLIALRHE
jgi:putative ABC transport system permease protein